MEQVQCAKCNSFKIKIGSHQTRLGNLLVGALLVVVSVLLLNTNFVPLMFLGFFLILACIIIILANAYLLITKKKSSFKCKNCGYKWH